MYESGYLGGLEDNKSDPDPEYEEYRQSLRDLENEGGPSTYYPEDEENVAAQFSRVTKQPTKVVHPRVLCNVNPRRATRLWHRRWHCGLCL